MVLVTLGSSKSAGALPKSASSSSLLLTAGRASTHSFAIPRITLVRDASSTATAQLRPTRSASAATLSAVYDNAAYRSGMLRVAEEHKVSDHTVSQFSDAQPTQQMWQLADEQYQARSQAWLQHVHSMNRIQVVKMRRRAADALRRSNSQLLRARQLRPNHDIMGDQEAHEAWVAMQASLQQQRQQPPPAQAAAPALSTPYAASASVTDLADVPAGTNGLRPAPSDLSRQPDARFASAAAHRQVPPALTAGRRLRIVRHRHAARHPLRPHPLTVRRQRRPRRAAPRAKPSSPR